MTGWKTLRRALVVALVAGKHLSFHLALLSKNRFPWLRRYFSGEHLAGPERLRRALEELGGAFLKLGQLLALQPDILPVSYCNALFSLLDRVAPVPYEEVERVIVEELGAPPDRIFESFDRTPIATASIGQVHVASLGGAKVAVKVQRHDIDRDFGGDIRVMIALLATIRFFRLRSLYWLIGPIDEFVGWTSEELDYRFEARYMERARANSAGRAHEYVPRVFWEHTRPRVLVVEFCEGTTVLDYLRAREGGDEATLRRLRASGFDPVRFAQHVIENFLHGAFEHGLFHSDLHPANLLIRPGNVVGYIDFGITGVLSRYARRHLVATTIAWMRADVEGISHAFSAISRIDADSNVEAYRRGLQNIARQWYDLQNEKPRFIRSFTMVMLDMLILARDTGVIPDQDITKYVRSTLATDGLVARLAPGFDIGHHLEATSRDLLERQTARELFSPDRWVAAAISSSRALTDTPARAAAIFDRIMAAGATMKARLERNDRSTESRLHLRTIRSAAILLALGILIPVEMSGNPSGWEWSFVILESLVAAAAAATLVKSLRRIGRATA